MQKPEPTIHMYIYSIQATSVLKPLSKVMYDQPAEKEEDDHSGPKDPFILLRSPLNHSYRVTTYP